MATVVHTNADGTTHTHGPTSAKIVALGTVSLGGATFMIDRDGQIEAGRTTEFGIEHAPSADGKTDGEEAASKRRRKSAVVPSGAWIANPDGKKLCEPVAGEGHDTADGENHWHFNVTPLYPVKKAKFVLQAGEEEAVVDFARGAAPCNDGILSVFRAADDTKRCGFLELKLHGDAGDLELWMYTNAGGQTSWQSHMGKPVPFDVPKETVIRLTFLSHAGKALDMRVRNGDKNEDEEGTPNMRSGGTNYFIFPGESGQDPEWLKGEDWRGVVRVRFQVDDKSFVCDPFVLVPHEAL
jgi:hypothetical protein